MFSNTMAHVSWNMRRRVRAGPGPTTHPAKYVVYACFGIPRRGVEANRASGWPRKQPTQKKKTMSHGSVSRDGYPKKIKENMIFFHPRLLHPPIPVFES